MPINELIPLQVRPPQLNIGGGIADFARLQFAKDAAAREERRLALEEQQAAQKQAEYEAGAGDRAIAAQADRDKALSSINEASDRAMFPFAQLGDVEGARSVLERRRQALEGAGIDTSHTQQALSMLDSDPEGLFKLMRQKYGEKPDAYTLGPGQRRIEGGKVVAEAPFKPTKSDVLSPEAFRQKVDIARAQGEVTRQNAESAARTAQDIKENSPTGQLRRRELEGKVSEQEQKVAAAAEKRQIAITEAKSKASNITAAISKARELTKKWGTTGFSGQMLSGIGGTDARNLKAQLDTIKANLAFDALQKMREASPTGGALGAVSERELGLLESAISSLDQAQDAKQLNEALDRIEQHTLNWENAVLRASGEDAGGGGPLRAKIRYNDRGERVSE